MNGTTMNTWPIVSGMTSWSVLPSLVEAKILTREQARRVVLAHEEIHRRVLLEIAALLPELISSGDLHQKGFDRISRVLVKLSREGIPDA